MLQVFTDDPRAGCWPFWVLEISPDAGNAEIDKAVKKIQGLISFGVAKANEFQTPLGVLQRDEYLLREAKSLLQDPTARLIAEFWYVEPDFSFQSAEESSEVTRLPADPKAWLHAFGVRI